MPIHWQTADKVPSSTLALDLSLKFLAWKGFIPRLQWKSPSPKQKFGRKKIMGPQKFWVWKLLVQRNCGSKFFCTKIAFGSKHFLKSKFWVWKKLWVWKENLGSEKKNWVWKILALKKSLARKNFVLKFWTYKNFGSKSILGVEKCGSKEV